MSSIRVLPQRADGVSPTQVLFRAFDPIKGKVAQTSESFDDHEQALKWQKILDQHGPEQARKILYAQLRVASSDVLTLVDWCHTHIKGLTGIEKGTRKRYVGYVENDIAPFFSTMLPLEAVCAYGADEISPVQEWVRYMEEERDYSAKTIANKHGFLSAALKAASKRRPPLIPFNPCEDTKLPDRHFEAAFLEVEEFALLYALTGARWRPQVLFRVTTGARPSEVTAANVGDLGRYLDRDGLLHHTFRISKAWKYTGSNKDQKLGTTKSKKGTRTVDVPSETVEELDLGRPKTALLFPTRDGGRITAQLFHNDCWGPIFVALEELLTQRPPALVARLAIELNMSEDNVFDVAASLLSKRPRPYDLWHTCASWMINGGASLADVQEHMGHESFQTTKDIYGHLDRHAGRRATAALSGALARTSIGQAQKQAV